MAKCKRIRRPKRQVCIADLDSLIEIQSRTISNDRLGVPVMKFTGSSYWAMIKTVSGERFFDNNNTEVDVTHHFYIRYDSNVTAQNWIEFDNERYKIIDAENLDERKEFMLLRCTNRGDKTLEASER